MSYLGVKQIQIAVSVSLVISNLLHQQNDQYIRSFVHFHLPIPCKTREDLSSKQAVVRWVEGNQSSLVHSLTS